MSPPPKFIPAIWVADGDAPGVPFTDPGPRSTDPGWAPSEPLTSAAIESIACGFAFADGGAGYVVVGPVPASVSGDGSRFQPNMFNPGIELRHPPAVTAAKVHPTKAMRVRFEFMFSIPANLVQRSDSDIV